MSIQCLIIKTNLILKRRTKKKKTRTIKMIFEKIKNEVRQDLANTKKGLKGTQNISKPLQEGVKEKAKQLHSNTPTVYVYKK